MVNIKPALKAEAPGQLNRPFSQEDQTCASVCCLFCSLRPIACQELSVQLFQSLGGHKCRTPGHQSQTLKGQPLCGLSIPVGFIHCGQGEVWSYGKLSGFSGATGDLTSVVSPSAAKELQGVCGVSQGLSVFGSSVSNKNVPPHATTDKFGSTKVVPAPLSSEKMPADPCILARYFKN